MTSSGTYSFGPPEKTANQAIKPLSTSGFHTRMWAIGQMQIAERERLRNEGVAKCVVYVAVNDINGRIYVGMTALGVERRAKRHIANAMSGRQTTAFCNAIRKYGPENFRFVVARRCSSAVEARKYEKWFIDGLHPEYNLTLGGEGIHGLKMNAISRAKMRAAKMKRADRREIAIRAALKLARPVKCVTDGLVFESLSAASRHYKLSHGYIGNLCRTGGKSRAGLRFCFQNN